MKSYIIIVAGGTGTRMNADIPKQFIPLQGKPILIHTIEKFAETIPQINIIVVLAKELNEQWQALCNKYNFTIPYQLINGGETRFHSVKNGLEYVPMNCLVGIHDAARPLVSADTILAAFKTANEKGNAIPAVSLSESIREVEGENNNALDRNKFKVIQTPQCFHSNIIKKAFEQAYNPLFTDDASVAEAMGEKINIIKGNYENIKITTPEDLIVVDALMGKK